MNLLFVFTLIGVWELCKLSGVIEKLSGGASIKPTDYLEDGIRTIPKGAVNATGIADLSGSKYISEDFFEKNITSHVHTNNLVTSLRDLVPSAPNMGRIVRIEGDEEQFLMPQGVYKLELFEGMDGDFLISFSNSDKYRKIISAEKNGSTQVHIRNGEFLNIDINLPSKYEQKKIGAFFKQLDNTITLHQRKSDQLKELKKAYLQLMFPTKEERVPKLRFAAFEGEWAHRKLGEITESFSGGTPTAGKSEYYGGDIPFIRSGEISSDSTELFITENGLNSSSAKMVKVGDILYALYGATSGEVGISKITGAINQAILAIRPSKNDNSYLIIQWLRKQKNTIISTYLQGGQGNLSSSIVKNLIIMLPQNKEEQEKVGMFFKQLDNIITLHQNKLEQLKDLKTSYLQNMFI